MYHLAALTFENVTYPWLWAILLALGAGVLYYTYQGIFERSERRLTWLLMLLRGAGLLALVLALAKPTWTHDLSETDPGRVVMIVDNSLSMSLADSSGKSRYALAKQAADQVRNDIERTRSDQRVKVELFDIKGEPLVNEPPAEPRLERTDLVQAVTGAISKLKSKLLVGLVIVSDGMDNTGRPDLQGLANVRVPIFPLGFRADVDAERLDLAIRKVQAPQRVMVNNQIQVDVIVAKTSGPATQAKVLLKRGSDQVAEKPVTFEAGNAEQVVSLNFTPAEAGNFVFTASVVAEAGEKLLANNAQHFPLQVDSEAIRVFYLEGFLRYEYKYLKERFEHDPDITLVSVVRRVNPERSDSVSEEPLFTAERLKNFDVVILGDLEAGYLGAAEYQALLKWVNDGHSLLVLGGYSSFGPEGFRTTPLAEALPVVFVESGLSQSEEPFALEVTDLGQRHPIYKVSGDRVQDAALWKTAPPLLGSSLVARAKPGADILAVNPLVTVEGKPAVIMAAQRYGAGHTLVMCADTTWRWSRLTRIVGQSDTLFSRFWSQMIRWLAGRDVEQQRSLITVSTDRPDYKVGREVKIRVQRQPQPNSEIESAETSVTVADEAQKSIDIPVRASSTEPDVFTGVYLPSAGGRFEVHGALTTPAGKRIANQTSEFLVHGQELELADTGTNRPLLESVATLTGGRYFDISEAGSVAKEIPRKERLITRGERTEFWNSPLLFLFFLATVTAEWVFRRKYHLV